MPLRLKGVLLAHGIKHVDYGKAVLQFDGKPMSITTVSLILNRNTFPIKTPAASIKQQTVDWLLSKGVPASKLDDIWEVDDADQFRGGHPAGVHLGQPSGRITPRLRLIQDTDFIPLEVEMLSPAAKRHFHFFRDPFQDEINSPDDVFVSDEQRYISEAMFQTAKNGGFLAVVGESGSGKTLLRKTLFERLSRTPSIRVVFPQVIDKSKLSAGNICQAIINDLAPGMTVRSSLEGQARQVHEVLLASSRADCSHVLIFEEAHDLDKKVLKLLKRFYELEDGFKRLLSIVLIGQPELRDKLDERRHPDAREVIRRIEIAELLPLGNQLEAYLAHKMKRQSIDPANVFAPDAYEAIRARWTRTRPGVREVQSMLYPLIVNNTVTKAMNLAAQRGIPLITADLIREV